MYWQDAALGLVHAIFSDNNIIICKTACIVRIAINPRQIHDFNWIVSSSMILNLSDDVTCLYNTSRKNIKWGHTPLDIVS